MSLKVWLPTLNRACQTHALLESCEKHAPGLFEFHINFDFTNEVYEEAYDKLMYSSLGERHYWEKRLVYGLDLYNYLEENRGDLFTHFVDDCIFYRENRIFNTEGQIRLSMKYEKLWGVNWRVGLDTTVNNHRDRQPVERPKSLQRHYGDFITWNYTEYNNLWQDYWAFPYSLDAFTYRVDDILDYLAHVDISSFTDPAQVEHHLCRSPRREKIERPWMIAPLYSNVFSNHLNSVHSRGYDPAGQFNVSYEWLNEKYLAGWKIDIDSLPYDRIQCGHEQLEFKLKRIEQ